MADLINRDAFIVELKERRAKAYLSELYDCDTEAEKQRIDDEMYYSTQSFIDVLMCEPAVDAMPVVRCKDCKNAEFVFDSIGLIKKRLNFLRTSWLYKKD